MKIKGSQVVELQISEDEQARICRAYLYKKFKWQNDYFIEDGFVKRNKTYYGSHSFNVPEVVREAQEFDYFVAGVIKNLSY